MRIGIDASNLRAGGGVTHLVEVLRHADPARHGIDEVIVWSGASTLARLPKDRTWLRLEHVADLDRALPFRLAWRRFRLPALARRHQCDLLLHPGGGRSSFRPSVTMCRNMIPFQWREMRRYGVRYLFWRALALRFVLMHAFRASDGVIFISAFARERIGSKLGPEVRTTMIPHGVSDRFRVVPRAPRSLADIGSGDSFRLLYTSIIDVYKHQWTVAEAVLRLRREGLPVSIDMVGPSYPPARKKLDAVLARAGGERDAVRVHDEVSHDRIADFARDADAFIFASTCENMPNILVEAMAAGLPIACSKARPMPDILQDAGLYFDAEDAEDIARVLRDLIADSALRAAKAKRAFELASALSWERCADETFAFLASVRNAAVSVGSRHPGMT